jgi:hypothetical protein
MARLGIFDRDLRSATVFDSSNVVAGWFDDDFIDSDSGGSMIGTATIAVASGTSSLKGTGTLAAPSTITIASGTTTLRGSGALVTATPFVALTGSGLARGTANAIGTGAVTLSQSGLVRASGALACTSTITISSSTSTVLGAAICSGTSTLTLSQTGNIAGSGTLIGTSEIILFATAQVGGNVVANGTISLSSSGSMTGSIDIAGTSTVTLSQAGLIHGTANCEGTSSLSINAEASIPGIANCSGNGSITLTATLQSVTASGFIDSLKTEMANLLEADPYFSDIPILNERVRELDFVIDSALNKIGLCVFVACPSLTISPKYRNLPEPYFDDVVLIARVFELSIVNGKTAGGVHQRASDVAEVIAALWQHHVPAGASEPVVITSIVLANDPKYVAYDVTARNMGGLHYNIPYAETPEITDDGSGNITITCDTTGVAVFYTINNTRPAPRKDDGTTNPLYSGPFSISSGTKVRAQSWLAGYLTNDEAIYTRS